MTAILAAAVVTCADRCMAESEKTARDRGEKTCTGHLLHGSLLVDFCAMVTCLVLVILTKTGVASISPTALYITMGIGGGIAGVWVLGLVALAIKKCCMSKELQLEFLDKV